MTKTFTKIERLLIEFERLSATQQALLRHGYATRTDAGVRFHKSVMEQLLSVHKKLQEYPAAWRDAVLTIIGMRDQHTGFFLVH